MEINFENLRLVVGSRAYEIPDLLHQYEMLMRVLHGDDFTCDNDALFDELLKSPSEALIFIAQEGVVLATAQVSFINTFPQRQAMINNVIVDPKHQGLGLGNLVMKRALVEAGARHRNEAGLRIFLTNSPAKGNAEFYEKLGFSPRTIETGNPTVVWEIVG